jgi:hypothetical protein
MISYRDAYLLGMILFWHAIAKSSRAAKFQNQQKITAEKWLGPLV